MDRSVVGTAAEVPWTDSLTGVTLAARVSYRGRKKEFSLL